MLISTVVPGLIGGAPCLLVAAPSLHHTKARDTKEVVQRYRGDFVTVEAHPAGACEVMAFSGASCCAGASNGGLLVPGACASVCFAWCVPAFSNTNVCAVSMVPLTPKPASQGGPGAPTGRVSGTGGVGSGGALGQVLAS